jgi:hypothetical protein
MRAKLIAGLVVAALFLMACSGREDAQSASPTMVRADTATASGTATPTRVPTPVAESIPRWILEEPIEIGPGPDQLDVMLYIEQGCTQCDGPPTAIERVYRDPNGELRREALFETPADSTYMTSTAVAADGTLYATACFGRCAEVGNYLEQGGSTLYTSNDGGTTWIETAYPNESRRIVARLPDGQFIVRVASAGVFEARFEAFPSGERLEPPGAGLYPWATSDLARPVLWENWETGERVYPDGTLLKVPATGADGPGGVPRLVGTQPQDGWLLNWFVREMPSGGHQVLAAFDGRAQPRWKYRGWDEVGAVIPVTWLDDHLAIAWLDYSAPALVDFEGGTVRRIDIGEPLGPFGGRNKPIGIAPRP